MIKLFFLLLIALISLNVSSQPWYKNPGIPSSAYKEGQKQNYHQLRDAFREYWLNKKVSENESENAKGGGFQQFARWEHFVSRRAAPSGEMFEPDALMQEFVAHKNRLKNNSKLLGNANWNYIGQTYIPANDGGSGRINCIRFHPTDPNTYYIGAACGGVWKTTDDGVTWSTSSDLLPSVSIADIAINPVHPDTVFVATGDGYGYETGSDFWGGVYTAGIWMSADGGQSWQLTPFSFGQTAKQIVQRLLIHPVQTNVLVTATRNWIYRSADAGQSWTKIISGHAYDLEFHPSNPDIIYAAYGTKVYKSLDAGLSFTAVSPTLSLAGRMSLAVTPDAPDVLYVLCEDGNFWKSSDAGLTYTALTSPATATTFFGYYDNVLAVSPTNENHLMAGGVGIVQSTDGGNTWFDAANTGGNDYVHVDLKDIQFYPGSGSTIFACSDGGIYRTTNNTVDWSDLGGDIHIKQYYRIGSAQSNPSIMYLGAQDNGTDLFDGSSWERVSGGDGMDCQVNYLNSNFAFVSSQYGNFSRTTNGGNSFSNITPSGQSGDWITPIALHPVNPSTIYIGYQSLYRSFNNGTAWSNICSNVLNGGDIQILRIAPSNPNYIYAGNLTSLKKSTDAGTTFTSISAGILSGSFTDLAISSTNPDHIWITLSNYAAGQKVYRSVDGGTTWTNVSGTLPNIPFGCIVYEPGSNDQVYAGSDLGVFVFNNSMNDWQDFNNQLPNTIVDDLEIIASTNKIRAATYGRGVWESNLNPFNALADDAGIAAIQNVPGFTCNVTVNPAAVIKNFGSSTLVSADINYQVDGGAIQTFAWTGNIASLSTASVTLPAITTADGLHTLSVYTTNPNGTADANTFNDVQNISFETETALIPSPVAEDFESAPFPPVNWRIINGNGMLVKETAAGGFGNSSSSLRADFFNTQAGTIEILQSDPIDLSILPTPIQLTFDVAYALYTAGFRDTLKVFVSNDCGLTWAQVYAKNGPTLATAPMTTQPFVPQPSEWRKEIVTLSSFAGSTGFIVRFHFGSKYGNNLYLDNINLDNTNVGINELAENSFSVFPNPAGNAININANDEFSNDLLLTLHDVTGRLALEKKISASNNFRIPVAHLSAGSYSLTISSGEKKWRKLIVKSY